MKLIINADDYGVDLDRDIGIFFCSIFRTITSTSVIVTNKLRTIQKKMIKNMNKRISVGIHINLTDNPLLTSTVEDFCKNIYNMKAKHSFWTNCLKDEINIELIKKEIEKQIEIFYEYFGFFPSHIDCHNHCNVFNKKIQLVCRSIANKQGVVLRIPYESYTYSELRNIFKSDNTQKLQKPKNLNNLIENYKFYYKYDMIAYNYLCNINCKENSKLKFFGSIYGYYRKASEFYNKINSFSDKDIVQFMTHPGFYVGLVKHRTKFSNFDRVQEWLQLIKIKKYCIKNNISMVNYRDIGKDAI